MAVSLVGTPSSGTSGSATAPSFTTTWPSGYTVTAGDVGILVGHMSATALSMGTPTGWSAVPGITNPTSEGSNSRTYVWRRVLQAGDSPPTITNSGSLTGGWSLTVYRGADPASPVGAAAAAVAAAATSCVLPTLAAVSAGSVLHGFGQARVGSGTIPNGLTWQGTYTRPVDVATSRITSAANLRLSQAYRAADTAGSYGGEPVTVGNTVASSMIVGLVEVREAAASPSSVTLTPAACDVMAVPVGAVPQPVSVPLSPVLLGVLVPPVGPVPQPVAVTVTAAVVTLAALGAGAAPGPVLVPLVPAVLVVSGQPVAAVAAPLTVTLTPAGIALAAVAVGALPHPVNLAVTPAHFAVAAAPAQPNPLPVTVAVTPAVAAVVGSGVQAAPLPVTVTVTPAALPVVAVPPEAAPAPSAVHLTAVHLLLAATPVAGAPRPVAAAHRVTARTVAARVTWTTIPTAVRRSK